MPDDSKTMAEKISDLKHALPTGSEYGNDIDLRKVKWTEIVEAFMALRWGKDVFHSYVE